jgi:hypothetical protein
MGQDKWTRLRELNLIEINTFSCYPWSVPGKLQSLDELERLISAAKARGKKDRLHQRLL